MKLTPDWFSAYSSSEVRYAGLMLTRIAPMAAVANWRTTHSYRLGDQIPIRSPFRTPRGDESSSDHLALVDQFAIAHPTVLVRDHQRLAISETLSGPPQVFKDRLA